ncbi:sugar phosphate isomerase/epimerase [Paenibacillus albicereus]|uniref:Sugar phosphate isomerase/epimerase n=1 Tax=Paenibacillus albicereus TaxID=2726185 RepID=A0A6H2H0S2_9BACL|nr:sugar phosphate isomerase/epimerase family protein [Paenibacillus albicereus]QJC53252.1 sugar phosphate isomerase/epimerase [Paenibacillus albicereus]
MNICLCSISFRHELVSFGELIEFADRTGFQGIELWGVHAKSLLRERRQELPGLMERMEARGLGISMMSDYVDLLAPEDRTRQLLQRWAALLELAQPFRARKIRIFAGDRPSHTATERDWALCVDRLGQLAGMAAEAGAQLVVETHPRTYADTLDATLRLLRDAGRGDIGINLDFLHLWESGTAPLEAYRALQRWIVNFHVKNVARPEQAGLFEPANVFSPSGKRDGMSALAQGAIDYTPVLDRLHQDAAPHPIAIEWFGEHPFARLEEERRWLAGWSSPGREAAHAHG